MRRSSRRILSPSSCPKAIALEQLFRKQFIEVIYSRKGLTLPPPRPTIPVTRPQRLASALAGAMFQEVCYGLALARRGTGARRRRLYIPSCAGPVQAPLVIAIADSSPNIVDISGKAELPNTTPVKRADLFRLPRHPNPVGSKEKGNGTRYFGNLGRRYARYSR